MTTQSSVLNGQLAINGGTPVSPRITPPSWPPVTASAEATLIDIYRSANWSFNGIHEQEFSRDFAAFHDAKFGIFMANGTVTLQCALAVHDVGPGDEVIVPGLTWIATAMAPLYLGATPVFVDIEPSTLCMDPAAFEAAITPATKAVIPVHLYGGMANLDEILRIANAHNIVVIEDCAHGQGGKWRDKGLGSWGSVGSFSFQQSKTMASGEGGICLTNDEELADRLYRCKHIGYANGAAQGASPGGPPAGLDCYNFRATEFQAAILQDQLTTFEELIQKYNRNAAYIEERLSTVAGIRPQSRGLQSTRQSYYTFGVLCDEEPLAGAPLQKIIAALGAEGLGCGGSYGPVYKHLLWNVAPERYRLPAGGCPVAETTGTLHSIQISHQHLGGSDENIEAIADALVKVAEGADQL